ncbi:MAG: putative glycoside hydrolase [Candidatus Pacebacteria bacterium]|nr:putative glycoside hydrolase [Candidatus Paceibacterota bacterium]
MNFIRSRWALISIAAIFGISAYAANFLFSKKDGYVGAEPVVFSQNTEASVEAAAEELPKITHIKTPASVKAIYMTSWVAGTTDWRESLVELIDSTELNSIVIDVKDYSGHLSFEPTDPVLKEIGSAEKRIPDVKEFINELHQKNIYVIARISVFQDPFMVKARPDLAVKKNNGSVWKDYKGITWIDPASKEYWDYIIRISKECEKSGFDELNFDYIRFPSDGNMKDISYDFWDEKTPKAEVMKNFYKYLSGGLKEIDITLSADLFGMTTWNEDDLNIGQVLGDAGQYFDYVAPMVYPSHYPATFQGYKNPAAHPYEIVYSAMVRGSEKLLAASTTPSKLRPWLQDFDLGADYGITEVRAQKKAVYDAGLTSWMLWAPSNKYTEGALD